MSALSYSPPTESTLAEAWAALERRIASGEPVTVRHLSAEAHVSTVTASTMLRGWLRAGSIRRAPTYTDRRPVYELVPEDERPTSPRRSAEQNMWDAMRGLVTFTPVDLSAHATTDDVTVTDRQASTYCQTLLAGGYLKVERKGSKSRPATYRLIRRTGPLAPLERRVRAVVDANTGDARVIGGGK